MADTFALGMSVKGRIGAATVGSDARTRRILEGDCCDFRGEVEVVQVVDVTRVALTIGFVRLPSVFTEVRLGVAGFGCKVVKILLNSLLSRRPCSRA